MKHRSHLKQQNKHFKKLKSHKKNNKSAKNQQKKKKKNLIQKYSSILHRALQSHNSKVSNIKSELEEKSKYIPFYNCLNICLLGFHEDADVLSFKKEFIKYLCEKNGDNVITDTINLYDIYTVHAEKKKKRSLVIYDIPRDIYGIIDGTKCADVVLCIFKDGTIEDSSFDELGYNLLSLLKIQGVPSVIGVGYNTDESSKYSQKFVTRYFNSEFTQHDKIFFINGSGGNTDRASKSGDFYKLYSEIMNMKVRSVSYREGRGYMMVNSYAYNEQTDSVYLKGFVKGAGFNVHNPVHITNAGDYYIDDIYVIDVMTSKRSSGEEKADKLLNRFGQRDQSEGFNSNFLSDILSRQTSPDANFYYNCNNIDYNFLPIQNCKNRCNMNEEDDLVCVRPYTEEEHHMQCDNLMTLMDSSRAEVTTGRGPSERLPCERLPSERLPNSRDDHSSEGVDLVYKFNLDSALSHGGSNQKGWLHSGSNGATCVEKPTTFNELYASSTNFSSNNTYGGTDQRCQSNHSWAHVSNEKHEVGEDFICSYNRSETLNARKYFLESTKPFRKEEVHLRSGEESRASSSAEESEDDLDVDDEEGDVPTNGEMTNATNGEMTNGTNDDDLERDSNNSDHVYLCKNISAKERFKKYRILQSFKSSYIDVYEDLPLAYSRIYDYENYENLSKYSKKKFVENSRIVRGEFTVTDAYCLFVIKNDGKLLHLINDIKKKNLPIVVSSLLPYERKVTVVNMEVERMASYSEKVESKEVFEIVCGFRHFIGCPIFSEQIIKGIQSKGKYEKHLKHGKKYVASIFGFTTVTNAPVFLIKRVPSGGNANLCFLAARGGESEMGLIGQLGGNTLQLGHCHYSGEEPNVVHTSADAYANYGADCASTTPVIVAHGKVVNCDCKRIIMKRISLCGDIFKIHKKKAVIRNMFYRPEDINYFKPAQLHTKFGLTGKILESLGTHGKMKCLFSNVLKQHDKVFIFLYKRVYPMWFPPTWGGDPRLGPDDKPVQRKMKR
ncbi:hypothetical protein PVIIG_00236 [Plasmodium vivax India VII]|uniref:Ribosome biogenesis protein TSR1 n=3 Tax=Plasmodium vivax TaxID=5855 RepID=A5K3N9_PLAVS|nr:hypothetical protein, conserved [Plasmodium vivax]EDL46143.1 hypothetical protein, conserved [Plasmodium vivax]KMZ78841.1 hypothetical protein PVIIG_00236 [Plasmodium vivax India VII]KMZ85226.1 hypothetical protein PVBG_01625 [Plasmodium vivax Brazil I]CAI7722367.1 ribosome biogenesis protein TSR1, putative [Plasmodium vivax]|eukprot:XP_001615870.1 hypothetical protein [Plasmodium vivax Sal-1]